MYPCLLHASRVALAKISPSTPLSMNRRRVPSGSRPTIFFIIETLVTRLRRGMYINRSGIEPPICACFILLFLIFLSISVQRIEGKSLGFDPTRRERRYRLFTPVARHTFVHARARTYTYICVCARTIVRPINAVMSVMSGGKGTDASRNTRDGQIYGAGTCHGSSFASNAKIFVDIRR